MSAAHDLSFLDRYKEARHRLRNGISMAPPRVETVVVAEPAPPAANAASVVIEPPTVAQIIQTQSYVAFHSSTIAKRIVAEVCGRIGVSRETLLSKSRKGNLPFARQEVMWRLHKATSWTLPRIGQYMGGLDHTTILYGIRRHQQRVDQGKV